VIPGMSSLRVKCTWSKRFNRLLVLPGKAILKPVSKVK
jgi:hypothetical protein